MGSDKGLGRVPGARLVSPKGVPRWWRDADRELRIGSGGWAVACVRCGFGRASASGALWRMAVGAAVPLVAGRVAASGFDGSGRMFRLSRGVWRRIFGRFGLRFGDTPRLTRWPATKMSRFKGFRSGGRRNPAAAIMASAMNQRGLRCHPDFGGNNDSPGAEPRFAGGPGRYVSKRRLSHRPSGGAITRPAARLPFPAGRLRKPRPGGCPGTWYPAGGAAWAR